MSKLVFFTVMLLSMHANLQAQTISLDGVQGSAQSGDQIKYSGQLTGLTPRQAYIITVTSYTETWDAGSGKYVPNAGSGNSIDYGIVADAAGNASYAWNVNDVPSGAQPKLFCPTNASTSKKIYGVTAALLSGQRAPINDSTGKAVQAISDGYDLDHL